jgi:hypothetical protein
VLPANNLGNVIVTQYTDTACKNQISSSFGQSNPSFYVLNSCTPMAVGDSSIRLKVTCLNGVIYVSVYADLGCTVKVYGGDQGYPNDVCVQQAGGSLLVKSDNCSSVPASPPPTSTAFNATVTAYTDSACKNSTPPSASQQNPSVYVLRQFRTFAHQCQVVVAMLNSPHALAAKLSTLFTMMLHALTNLWKASPQTQTHAPINTYSIAALTPLQTQQTLQLQQQRCKKLTLREIGFCCRLELGTCALNNM